MTQFCGFQHPDAGNLLRPIVLIPETALDFCPTSLLPPGSLIGNFLYVGLKGEVLRCCHFHYYSWGSSRAFLSFASFIRIQILIIR